MMITDRRRGRGRETRIRIQENRRQKKKRKPTRARFPQTKRKSGVEEVPGEANNREFMRCDGMGKQIEERWRSWQSWDLSQLDCLLDPFPIQTTHRQGRKVLRLRDPTNPCVPEPQHPGTQGPGPGHLQTNGSLRLVAPLSFPGTDGEAARHS